MFKPHMYIFTPWKELNSEGRGLLDDRDPSSAKRFPHIMDSVAVLNNNPLACALVSEDYLHGGLLSDTSTIH